MTPFFFKILWSCLVEFIVDDNYCNGFFSVIAVANNRLVAMDERTRVVYHIIVYCELKNICVGLRYCFLAPFLITLRSTSIYCMQTILWEKDYYQKKYIYRFLKEKGLLILV